MASQMEGKVCLLTGATQGIGRAAALEIARRGATLVLVGRDAARGAEVVSDIKQRSGNPQVELLVADLSSQAAIAELAAAFPKRHDRLDVLINNAGAVFTRRQVSPDGLEMTFALNHMAYFQLTALLLPLLKRSAPARIVNVSSEAHKGARIDFADLQNEKKYSAFAVYGKSKLANILFTKELARRLEGSGVTANCLHPGFVRSGFGQNNSGLLKLLIRLAQSFALTPEDGAKTVVYLATAAEVEGVTGKYFIKCKESASSAASRDLTDARRLWEASEQLIKPRQAV